ncbi:EntF Non-ribosomal peptide synthetase modules [Pyrenophora tritici-repentis]|nr:EntF Non-ribosomal peptide synthetase module [Pyrenophora tritici-repentis]KAI1552883.1 EntF Non-ribosomal peptide synthetase modules [Pyrenophora tritici-repentis]
MVHQVEVAREPEMASYWTQWKEDATPCYFPSLIENSVARSGHSEQNVILHILKRHYRNLSDEETRLDILTAWSIVLQLFTGNASVSFRLTSQSGWSRLCSATVERDTTVETVRSKLRAGLTQSENFRVSDLNSNSGFLELNGRPYCNTAVTFNTTSPPDDDDMAICLHLHESNHATEAKLIYSRTFLEEDHAADIVSTFQQVLSEVMTKPTAIYSELQVLHPISSRKLFEWNTVAPASVDRCVGELFEDQANHASTNMAIHASDASFTYAELESASRKLALVLQAKSVGPEDVVLLSFPKSAWALVAMMAAVRAGATMLFFDVSHPMARLQEIQNQVQARIMLTAPQYADAWDWTGAEVLAVDSGLIDSLPDMSLPTSAVRPNNSLYIIYTSGSTGKPKGCCIEHRQFLTGSYAQRKASGMRATDRVLQLASFSFDVSLLEIMTSLITGACVCIPGDASRSRGPAHCIQEFGVTWAFLTPSLVKLMTPDMVPTLRFLVLGGEALGKGDVETWAPTHVQLANGYGPTECSVAATALPNLSPDTDPSNIGFPLGALIWIVDPEDHRRLVPPGCPGELLVHGPIVARGYYKDAERTNAVFISDDFPWLPRSESAEARRMYRSGDLARFNSDGSIHFLGRKGQDSQVKLRGLRIELGEIEHHIAKYETVRRAAVLLPRQGPCKDQLTVVLSLSTVPDPESDTGIQPIQGHFDTAEQIKQDVSAHLPPYMVPSLWIVASSVPLSISGKLNRSAVTQFVNNMDEETYNLVTGDVSEIAVIAASPVEEILQQACSEILNVPASSIRLNRSFIHNGLDSILGMQLLSRLRAAGIAVSMQDMLQSKSLSELAERAQTGDAVTTLQTYPISYDLARFESEILPGLPVEAEDVEEVYPLGIMQKGILLSQQRESASYELRILCRATLPHGRESMDIDRLKNALKQVSNRHASLRTIFTPSLSDNSPCDQLVLKNVEPQISVVSCRNEAHVRQLVHQYSIANADKGQRPRVGFVIYVTEEHLYCMAAIDHALIDGVSVLLMFRDLSAAYAGDLDLTHTTRFSHYVGYLQQQDKSVSMDFWRQYLQGISTCSFPVLNDNSHGSNELHELTASVDQSLGLHDFCRTHDITPASLLHLAWAMTLRAYSGTEDVCFGYLSAGRDLSVQDIDDAVGAYINMLVCRLDLGELASSNLLQLAESVQQSFLKSMPHQLCSLAEIQHELQLRGPLFNTVLSLQSALGDIIQASEHSIAFEIVDEVDLTEYDISVNIAVARDDVHLSFRHYTSKVSDQMASNVLGTFQNMIRVIVQGHEKRLDEIDLLSDNDKQQILSWNEMIWEDHQRCIHDIISEQARQKPNALAIDAYDGRLTYAELDSISSLLAAHLSELGVGPETLVPLCFKKSMWVPVAQLAVLKAGGACVAMDPTHPEKRREELLRQCDAKMALTSPEYIHLFKKLVGKALAISKSLLDGLLEKQSTLPKSWIQPTPSNSCFVVFTSGSTGKPKGIVLEHHALASSSAAHGPIMQYNQPGARILQFASYTFDVSIGETFSGLQMGGTVCIPAEEERLDDLAGVINRMNINIAYLTPSVASLLEPADVPGLKVLALGGEAVRAENVAAWADKLHLIDIYGPAETSVYSTGLSPVTLTDAPGNIGFGLGARMWVTDAGNPGRLCHVGEVGELLIQGPIVARGYLNDVEKTSAAFIPPPRWMVEADMQISSTEKLYRSGDLCRYNSDGSINVVGRKDMQIKLHGQRIEMAEIEYNILRSDSIANAVVLYPRSGPLGERLVAVIALRESSTLQEDTKTMRLIDPSHNPVAAEKIAQGQAYLGKRVPGYMMPSVWLCFDILPLSRNEKTDRVRVLQYVQEMAAIPGVATHKSEEQAKVSAPLNSTEATVQGIVAGVLGQPQSKISMDQSFVGMAGDSIQAMQAVAKCRTNGLSVTVKDVLMSKSLRDLAKKARSISSTPTRKIGSDEPFALLANATLEALDKDVKKIGYTGSDDLEDAYPASPMQQGLLIAQAQASGNYKFFALCEATALKSGIKVSVERLRSAWQQVVNRHAILRTVFVETSNANNDDVSALYTQAVLKQSSAREAQVGDYQALLDQPWTHPIDYEDGLPLHRFTTYENATDGKVYFNLEISHTLIDGASMAIILRDLVSAYQHQSQGPAPLYRNYISMLVERQHSEVENSLTYWSQYLEGVEPCIMPKLLLDQSAPVENTLENVKVNLPSDTVKKLHAFSKANAVTLASILQTAWAIVVRAYSSNPDVVFGFLASGRDISLDGLENALGPYINMLICRVDAKPSNKDSILTTIQKAQGDYLDSLAHQHTPLSQIQHSILDASAGSRIFNSVLSIQRPLSTDDTGNEIKIECVQSYDPTEYDCSVSITASEAAVEANISYMSTYYTTQQATRIGKTFSKILTDMLEDPTAPLTSLEFITPEDKQIILHRNKNGVVPPAAQHLIHEQVARQAVERPSAPAIASWDGSYSYEELISIAGRLAHHLRNNGVTTEQKVLLAFDKSKWAVVSMLAVLLAGGTYLSVDPAHPPQHHRNIIEQAEPVLLLTGSNDYAEKLRAVIEPVIVVDETMLAQLQDQSKLPDEVALPANGAFICTTSGSTGRPKAITITHSSFSSVVAHNPEMGIGTDSRVFQFASYTFDTANSEIWAPLMLGACVCIPSENERMNDTAGAINRLAVNWSFFTPSMASLLSPADIPGLKTLALGAECSVWTTMADIGHGNPVTTINKGNGGYGSLLWIADTTDVTKLAPIGATGELLVEGPILSRGYLDLQKSAEAFIPPPPWRVQDNPNTRLYRSGDLVRYNEDGTVVVVGRQDGQVKLNGQRIECSEIERNVAAHDFVRFAVIFVPKKGICQRKLTAVVALQQFSERTMVSKELRPISPENAKAAAKQIEEIKEQLRSRVPGYMVPTSWLIVESMALTPSKKVDRVTIARWVETLSNETYTQALDTTAAADQGAIVEQDNLSPEVKLVQRIIAAVLNIPLDQVDLNKSFLNLGGDSIQAIGTVVQCRKEGLRLTVKAIMQSKSLYGLAAAAEKSDQPQSLQQEELVDVPFELSPIQKLYFSDIARSSREPEANQFNQSFLLAVTAKQGADEVANALRQLVEYHPLLRARYSLDKDGSWTQMIPKQLEGSFHFASHAVDSDEEARAIARKQQEQHRIETGAVFAVVLLNINSTGKQLLFLTAHHLVIDLVSWRIIIRQLEDLLTVKGSHLPALKPFPFHSWIKAQADYSTQHLTPESSLLHEVPAADYSYWGMQGEQNLRRDIAEFNFTLDANSTDGLLRNCHSSMKTEALDILLAAAFSSFAEAFSRTPPSIFNEGHGRESWDSSRVDVTETVGWFTTMYPLHVSPLKDDLTGIIQQLKDQRRSLPRKGWSYFNSAVSNPAGRAAFAKHWPVEILFNYLGVYQGQEQQAASGEDASLLQIIPFNEGDFGPQVNRFSLIDINTYVLDGKAHVSLTYNRNMKHVEAIERWVQLYQQTLGDMICALEQSPRILTPGDFPLLQNTSYTSLQRLQKHFEPSVTPVDNIEDIYACSPMQEGILLTQNRMDGAYHIEMVVQVSSVRGAPIDVPRLVKAWQMVVDRQVVLRTVFVEGLSDRPYDQLLLKAHSPLVKLLGPPEGDAVSFMNAQTQVFSPDQPPHCLTILHDNETGLTLCKLEISHALVDGASMSILVSDWVEAYQNPSNVSPGPLYSDYIGYIQSQPRAAAIDFWKSQLSGVRACHFPNILESDTEAEEAHPLRQVDVKIPEASQVRQFCQEHNVTLASIFRLAWAKVLRAFTGDDQVCFGYLASGREIPVAGIEEAVGAFINMLVCSIDFDATSQQSAITSLDKLQDEYLQSLPYQHVSLAEIQHELGLSSGQKLFNTVLSFQRRPHQDFFAGDLHLRYIDGVDPTEYPISISISDDAGKIHVQMSYFASILSDAQAASVSNALSSILASILDTPQVLVAQLKMESDEDRKQIFSWNSDIPATVDKCVHEVFEDSVKRAPGAVAIDSFEGTMSYSELDLKSSILGAQLMQHGVTAGDFIPIAFEKSVWAIVSMMGIMKTGAGYVPLDMAHPDDRLKTIISQLGDVRLILASQTNTKRMQMLADNVLTVSSGALVDTKSTSVVLPAVNPESTAYCLFTSGTSGVPKGVVLSHRAVNSSTFHHGALIDCNSSTRMYQFAAFTFDACILEIFTTLMYGGTICLPSDDEKMSDIVGFINRKQVNTAFMTPSLVRIVRPDDILTMKTLILGGEALGADNIAIWASRLRLMNGYGPTETCVFAVMKTFEGAMDRNDVLGKGVASQTWIVNPDDPTQLAPLGAVGMLHLSGPALADGYLGDQAKTDSVFLENPGFLRGERAYNTGDRARYSTDGSIIYLGRADQQTKLRGQRIELTEIETHTLSNLPDASGVCVDIVLPGGLQDKACLAAFFCLEKKNKSLLGEDLLLPVSESVQNDIVRLQRALEAALPPYEVPALYIPVSKMPTTTAGKLDRRSLRETIASMPQEELLRMYSQSENSKKPLTTAAEQTLALAWSEVLKIPVSRIGSDDNFFRVGGDSISAMVLASKRVATVADIFKHPVLSDMAAVSSSKSSSSESCSETVAPFSLLDGSTTVSSIGAKSKVSPDDVEDAYPCTPLQEGLMALSLLNPGSYILRKVLRLPTSIDLPMFKEAWDMTVANNPILRTTIIESPDACSLQVVLKHDTTSLWRTASSLQEYLDQDEQESFTFGMPLSRYGITADGHFVWTAHHAIYDGWTLPLILNQVRAYYTSSISKRVPGFNSFVKYITSTTHEEAHAYWKNSLSGGKPTIAFPEPPPATHTHRHRVNGVAHQRIAMQLQSEVDVPTATLLRAAWAYVLAQYSDAGEDNDVVFGTTLSGRSCPVDDITEIVGPTITTVPVRMGIPTGEVTVGAFLKEVQDQTTDMMPFEHFGLRNIANINADTAAAVQFQNLFVVQPMAQRFDIQPEELLGAEEVALPLKNFDTYPLVWECSLDEKDVHVEARFDQTIVPQNRVERMLRHFEHIVSCFQQATEKMKMEDITMLTTDEMTQILDWNNTYPEILETNVPAVFAEQVKLRPDALAVDAWDGKLTYAELDRLSTALAGRLNQNHGIGPEVLVPLCFQKSMWAVATQLSVMKAGGAVVNLDPAQPLDRIQLILRDADAKVVLTASHLAKKFETVAGLTTIAIDEQYFANLPLTSTPALPVISPQNPAYVLFTSGSTGLPKGIVIEHRSLCSSSKAHGTAWNIGPSTRLLQFAAYQFDVSAADIFTTLQRGGCICVPSDNERLNDLAGAINRFQCNWAFLTPTVASLLPAEGIPSLRKLVLGGEASTRAIIAKWHSILDLIVCYGPAETTVYSSGAPPATVSSNPADIGSPIGVLNWIVDPSDHNKLVPIGCTGELILEGPTVARGYLHNEEKTAAAFVTDPAWTKTGDKPRRFYRTGDLVRYNEDGTIHFVGRKDTMMKIRGQRVEAGEIEHAIRARLSTLGHVVVDSARPESLDSRTALIAYLQPSAIAAEETHILSLDPIKEDLVALQTSLSGALPHYMLPNYFIPISRVPLTTNGKTDRRKLKELVSSLTREQLLEYGLQTSLGDKKQQPSTSAEFALRDLWAQTLGVDAETIGTDDQFFRIGGDSILAIKLVSTAAKQGLQLSVTDFFESPALSDMAKVIGGRTRSEEHDDTAPYKPFSLITDKPQHKLVKELAAQIKTTEKNIIDVLPATDFQKNAVAHGLMKTRGFRNYLWLDRDGDAETKLINPALQAFVAQHEILRTVFAVHGADIVQTVLRYLPYEIEWHETADDIESSTMQISKQDAERPVIMADPQLKFFVVAKAGAKASYRLIMRISHAQYDGSCLPQLLNSLVAALECQEAGPISSMAPYFQEQAVSPAKQLEAAEYWQSLLHGSTMTSLVQHLHETPSYKNIYNTQLTRTIPTPSAITAKHGITFATILKLAWSLTVSSLSSSDDVTFGHVVSGRPPSLTALMGPCLNVIPVRVSLKNTATILSLLRQIQNQHASSYPFEATLGTRTIVRDCTSWPQHTRFSSIVQHQNIDETTEAGEVGAWCPEADEADVAIKTTPKDGSDAMEVAMICSNVIIGMHKWEAVLDALCEMIAAIGEDESKSVGEVLENESGLRLPLIRHDGYTNGHMNGIIGFQQKTKEKARLPALWREILGLSEEQTMALDYHSDFFALGGDLVTAAVLVTRLQQMGYGELSVEMIIDHSRFGQMVKALGAAVLGSAVQISFTVPRYESPRANNKLEVHWGLYVLLLMLAVVSSTAFVMEPSE